MRISKTQTALLIACLVYAAMLKWSYSRVEGVVGFPGMTTRDVPVVYSLFGFVVIGWVAAFVLPRRATRPSHVALWVLFLTWFVPCLLLTYHVGRLPPDVIFRFVLGITGAFLILTLLCRGRPLTPPRLRIEHTAFAIGLAAVTLPLTVAVFIVARQTSLDPTTSLFDLTLVLARRLEARSVMADHVLLGYGMATLGSSLAPICLAYGFLTRRHVFTALGAAGLLSLFVMDGTKSNIFLPVMLTGFMVLAERPGRSFGLALALGLTALVAGSMYMWLAQGNLWLSALLVRRMIVAKAMTMGAYFETFRGAPVYMKDTSLVNLFGMRPAVDKSNLVGEVFGAGIEENWNGSTWAEMYGDFGMPGLLIASVVMALILRCYDGTTKRAPFPLVCAMAGYGAYVWGETAVTTSILTYGVLATLVLLSHYGQPRIDEAGTMANATATAQTRAPSIEAGPEMLAGEVGAALGRPGG